MTRRCRCGSPLKISRAINAAFPATVRADCLRGTDCPHHRRRLAGRQRDSSRWYADKARRLAAKSVRDALGLPKAAPVAIAITPEPSFKKLPELGRCKKCGCIERYDTHSFFDTRCAKIRIVCRTCPHDRWESCA